MRGERGLHRRGIGLEEVGVHERQQAILARGGRPRAIAAPSEVHQRGHRAGHLVRGHRDQPVAAGGRDRKGEPVVAREHGEAVGPVPQDLHDLPQVAAGFLDARDVRVLGQAERGGGQQVDRGAAGDVVEADRAGGGVGDGLEVAGEAVLGGLVVVGRGAEDAVDAERAHSPGLVDGAARCRCWWRRPSPAPGRPRSRPRSPPPARARARPGSAPRRWSRTGTRKSIPSAICHSTSARERAEVDRAVVGERRDQRGAASLEARHRLVSEEHVLEGEDPASPGQPLGRGERAGGEALAAPGHVASVTVSYGPS